MSDLSPEDLERAAAVLEAIDTARWLRALDPNGPPWLGSMMRESVAAYERGDIGWVLEHTHPEVEISQPEGLPGARSYHGHAGVIECLLDWPGEWEELRVLPSRIFAVGDRHIVIDAIHRGRAPATGIEVEARIAWLYAYEDDLLWRWTMYLDVDDAIAVAEAAS